MLRWLVLAILTIVGFSPVFALKDGDDFALDGINYTVISEADKTCKTKEGTYSSMYRAYIHSHSVRANIDLPSHPNGYELIEIGFGSFSSMDNLKSISIPESVTRIEPNAFYGCYHLYRITIPKSVINIGNYAFYNCRDLKQLNIPASVKEIGLSAFENCSFKPLVINGNPENCYLWGLENTSVIYCPLEFLSTIPSYYTKYPLYDQFSFDLRPMILGAKLSLVDNPYFSGVSRYSNLRCVITDEIGKEVKTVEIPEKEGDYIIDGLNFNSEYTISYLYSDIDGNNYKVPVNFTTKGIEYSMSGSQTKMTFNKLELESDETFQVKEIGIQFDGISYPYKGKQIEIKNLYIDTQYNFALYALSSENKAVEIMKKFRTNSWLFSPQVQCGPTTLILSANEGPNEVHPTECWWEFDGVRHNGKNVIVTSLVPDKNHNADFYVIHKYNNGISSRKFQIASKSISTSKIEFKTLNPKCVSEKCAIVAAETNISEYEPLVGFQWKKYDAPSSLAPNEGYGAVNDGILEGYIKNLQSAFYYEVRPFYKDASGKYYYGDWVTFDPSDFSFFEPTVRTYPVQDISDFTATVRGYALAGSDNIKRQGFQYWVSSSPKKKIMYAPSNSEISTIVATGQIMTATFENLLPGTAYTYRAFVETDAGFKYGEEQTFRTTDLSGISGIEVISSDESEPEIIGYFDMTGRRYATIQKGINIIVYSNGTTRKVIMK